MAEALQVVSLDGLFVCTVYSHARHSVISFAADTVFLLYLAVYSGGKENPFSACHSGKLKKAFTSANVISTSPKSFLTSRIDFTVIPQFEFLKNHYLRVGQVKNRIH